MARSSKALANSSAAMINDYKGSSNRIEQNRTSIQYGGAWGNHVANAMHCVVVVTWMYTLCPSERHQSVSPCTLDECAGMVPYLARYTRTLQCVATRVPPPYATPVLPPYARPVRWTPAHPRTLDPCSTTGRNIYGV